MKKEVIAVLFIKGTMPQNNSLSIRHDPQFSGKVNIEERPQDKNSILKSACTT